MKLVVVFFAVSIAACTAFAQVRPSQRAASASAQELKRQQEYEKHGWGEGRLKVGDPAPDFDLKKLNSDERVRLSSFANKKPVVLVFGTYTCPRIREQINDINELARIYRREVEFLMVYIREAHPTDGWQDEANEKAGILLPSARSLEEKEGYASTCALRLHLEFTTLIDGLDNRVEQDYAAWPNRLYLVGRDGRVAWKGGPGPAGFIPWDLAVAIEEELER